MGLTLKRSVDLVISLVLLIVLLPIMGVIGALILVTMGKPILFTQARPGYQGRLFVMLKFRTMSDRRNAAGDLLPDAERLGWLGRVLRASSLDELPELINVLRGDMSLVGPRPLLPEYLPLYNEHQARRHQVRPGITGWAQVRGRNRLSWQEKFDLDVWYVDHQSLWLDLRILLMTLVQIVKPGDVHQAGEATMSKFTGNSS